jgi:hypothetical protein
MSRKQGKAIEGVPNELMQRLKEIALGVRLDCRALHVTLDSLNTFIVAGKGNAEAAQRLVAWMRVSGDFSEVCLLGPNGANGFHVRFSLAADCWGRKLFDRPR